MVSGYLCLSNVHCAQFIVVMCITLHCCTQCTLPRVHDKVQQDDSPVRGVRSVLWCSGQQQRVLPGPGHRQSAGIDFVLASHGSAELGGAGPSLLLLLLANLSSA